MKKKLIIGMILGLLMLVGIIGGCLFGLLNKNDVAGNSNDLKNLIFELNSDGNSYCVIGNNIDMENALGWVSITIPDIYNGKPVTKIGERAFVNCIPLTNVTIPDSVTSIGNSAFESCISLTNITIPDSVTSIGDYVFWGCESLVSIFLPDSVKNIGAGAFSNCHSLTNITIPDSVTSIGDSAFEYCRSLTSITIPNSVTSIGDSAFLGCESLTSIFLPDSLTNLGRNVFSIYGFLPNATYSAYNEYKGVYYLGNEENPYLVLLDVKDFANKNLEIHSDTKYICLSSFGISGDNVFIPASVICISDDCLRSMFFENIVVDENNQYYKSVDGVLYSKNGKSLLRYSNGGNRDISFTIPDTVTSINANAFSYIPYLVEICNKSSVDLRYYDGNNYIESPEWVEADVKRIVTDESQSALKAIGDYIFYDDGAEIYLMRYLGNDTEIVLPEYEGGKEYGLWEYSFCENKNIVNVYISEFVTNIDAWAFGNCISLTSVNFIGTVEQWNAVDKSVNWNAESGAYTIYCIDGQIAKDGTVTYK